MWYIQGSPCTQVIIVFGGYHYAQHVTTLSKELIHFLVFIKTVRVFTFDVSQSIYAFIPHHYATLEFRGEDVVLRNFCALGVNFRIMRDRKLKDNTGKRKGEPGEEMN